MRAERDPIDVGVVGVGAMGQHHARVYDELPAANFVGVFDADESQARKIARKHDVMALNLSTLLDRVDAVSVAVPTRYHYRMAMECLDAEVGTLIEKPVLPDLDRAEELQSRVDQTDVPVQVGHIERFNPAVTELSTFIEELSLVSLRCQRLGPTVDRTIEDSAVLDLMIHDIDIVLSLLGESPTEIQSAGVDSNRHASALLEFDSGVMASLTASRKTQRKVRTLEITAEECFIELDYLDQSIEIHRKSLPEYIEDDGDVRFKHEHIVERPTIHTAEPLRKELESFIRTVEENRMPKVTVQDGLEALSVAYSVEEAGLAGEQPNDNQ